MKGKLTLDNGKEIEITINDEQLKELCVKPKDGRVADGESYFMLFERGAVFSPIEKGRLTDKSLYDYGNYYHTEAEAEFARDKQLFITKYLRRIKELNGDWVADWESGGFKYINCIAPDKRLVSDWFSYRYKPNAYYFRTTEIGLQLTTEFGKEDIIKYLFD